MLMQQYLAKLMSMQQYLPLLKGGAHTVGGV